MSVPTQTTGGLRIHLRHVRAVDPAGGPLCAPSIRAWCRQQGIDLRTLCEDGIAVDAHPHLHDDPFVARAIVIARAEADGIAGSVDAP
ncbi:MAG: hypothetical protein KF800_13720 [Lysobacter sp.]|nr:hypothetical protein [Lysobacter sp.]